MKNANDVLRQKEADLARIRHEIDSLKIVTALLADDDSSPEDLDLTSGEPGGKPLRNIEEGSHTLAEPTGTDGLFSSFIRQRPRGWSVLKRHT